MDDFRFTPTSLEDRHVEEFREIVREKLGIELSVEEARPLALQLVQYLAYTYMPLDEYTLEQYLERCRKLGIPTTPLPTISY